MRHVVIHTKGHLWIEGRLKHYRWAYYELHLSSIQLVIFTFRYVKFCMRLFIYATRVLYATLYICNSRVVREYRLLHLAYKFVCGLPLEQLACHTRVASIDTHVHVPLTLKIKTRDYLRLVKHLTLITLTVSTSSTFETALFHQV